jgi:hypothetical protein
MENLTELHVDRLELESQEIFRRQSREQAIRLHGNESLQMGHEDSSSDGCRREYAALAVPPRRINRRAICDF